MADDGNAIGPKTLLQRPKGPNRVVVRNKARQLEDITKDIKKKRTSKTR